MSGSTSHGTMASEEDGGDHISVVLRTRPLNIVERQRRETNCLRYPGNGQVEVDWQGVTKYFKYNVVFEDTATQQDTFEHCGIKRLVELTIDGYACTCFAYGQTGSGKTHTITGPPSEFLMEKEPNPDVFGVMPRAFIYLYRQIRENKMTSFRVHASYFEIYNEQVVDLLNPDTSNVLGLRWQKGRGFYVENLFLIECETLDDLMGVLETGMKNRAFNSTNPNEYSSRSHSLFTIMVDAEDKNPQNGSQGVIKHGKLTFVDLAGSEKVKDGDSLSTEQLQETQNINRSLLVLGNCISALGDSKKKNGHIPYRDSKLTKLLADSLGGNGVTLMIACISPSVSNATETINTLRYSARAKNIQTKPSVKTDPKEDIIRALKGEIRQLRQENKYLKENVHLPEPSNRLIASADGLPPIKSNFSQPNDLVFNRDLPGTGNSEPLNFLDNRDQIHAPPFALNPKPNHPPVVDNTLYTMLQEYMTENESLRSENSDLQKDKYREKKQQKNLRRENELLSEELNKIKKRLTSSPRKDAYSKQRYDYTTSRSNYDHKAPFVARVPKPEPQPYPLAGASGYITTPTPLRGIPSPPPPLSETRAQPDARNPVRASRTRDKMPVLPYEGDTYANIYDGRRHSPTGTPRHRSPLNTIPRKLSPIQPSSVRHDVDPAVHPHGDFFDMNKNLRDELTKLDRTIRQHQRVNALNKEIRNMSRK